MLKRWHIYLLGIALAVPTLTNGQELYSIKKLSLNTPASEYGVSYYKDGIVFSSNRKNDPFFVYQDSKTKRPLTDLFYASLDSLANPKLFSADLKTSYHDGPITFSEDGLTAYFTRNQRAEKKWGNDLVGENLLGVYKAEFMNGKWQNVEDCAFNNKEFSTGHPALSPDGKTLYVISTQPGGYGGTDIYKCAIENGVCGPLVNLGPEINTEGNEMFPFMHSSGQFFFASDGHPGMGGLDIFKSEFLYGGWEKPTALDTAFNSPYDDFGFVTKEDLSQGHFSSNRSGSDDIYAFDVTFPEFAVCDAFQKIYLCYDFEENSTSEYDTLPLIYEWDFGDGTKTYGFKVDHCFPGPGFYEIHLNIIDTVINRIFMHEATYSLEIIRPEQPHIEAPDTILTGTRVEFDSRRTKWSQFEINKFYWDLGDGRQHIGNKVSHAFTRVGTYPVRLGITSALSGDGSFESACAFRNIVVVDTTSATGKRLWNERQAQITGQLKGVDSAVLMAESTDGSVKQEIQTDDVGAFSLRELPYDKTYTLRFKDSPNPDAPIILIFNEQQEVVMVLEMDESGEYTYKRELPEGMIDPNKYLADTHLSIPEDSLAFFKDSLLAMGFDDPESAIEKIIYRLELMRAANRLDLSIFDALNDTVLEHFLGEEELYLYTIGAAKTPVELYREYIKAHKAGFDKARVTPFELDSLYAEPIASINEFDSLTAEAIGAKTIVLENLQFNVAESALDASDIAILQSLVDFLKASPEARIVIMAHTDDQGNDTYNLLLSRARAQSVVNHLLENGIEGSRLNATGYGESRPIATNTTEEGRSINRRVEFRLLKQEP